jgi:hypothetical protein
VLLVEDEVRLALTLAYVTSRDWPVAMPVTGLAGGTVAALAIGTLAGLYPASRAARLEPAVACAPADTWGAGRPLRVGSRPGSVRGLAMAMGGGHGAQRAAAR